MAPSRAGLRLDQQEATTVAGLFPKGRGLLLVGSHRDGSRIQELTGRYQVLHLATHGYFDKFNPLLSGLDLEADGREDGRLEVHEILGMRLNTRLVVLSACDTALGGGFFAEVPAGDDIVGLGGHFCSPAARRWWPACRPWDKDQSTMKLMSGFYGRLLTPNVGRGFPGLSKVEGSPAE